MSGEGRHADDEKFASEPLIAEPGSMMASAMGRGEPGLPQRFTWRGQVFEVREILAQWKSTGDCSHGSGEKYVRRHWYRVHTEPDAVLTLYCDRQARDRGKPKRRWFVFSYRMAE